MAKNSVGGTMFWTWETAAECRRDQNELIYLRGKFSFDSATMTSRANFEFFPQMLTMREPRSSDALNAFEPAEKVELAIDQILAWGDLQISEFTGKMVRSQFARQPALSHPRRASLLRIPVFVSDATSQQAEVGRN